MPNDSKNPDSLGDDRTFVGEGETPAKSERSLGDAGTHADGGDSSLSDLSDPGDALDLNLPLIDLARFEIEGELGKGGMGAVQLATDRQLKRKVAIKRIHASSQSALARFVTEAQSIAALNHFNIVQVHDFGRDADGPLLIMEYVSGGSLLDRLKEGKLEVEEAVSITCQLCDALAVAHEQGIIHRDIKPANILLTTRGEPKLTDFGLARQESVDHGQTQEGAVLGTIDFMPLEQRRDSTSVDERSDLWSLAATAYQMITGDVPRVIDLDAIPRNLRSTFTQALKQNPDERFPTAGEFKTSLRKGMATMAAPLAAELAAGICPSCGTANDVNRKFCRGCRASLIEPCLKCEQDNPVWEDVCGECGSSQKEEQELVREELSAVIEESLALAGEHEYEKALEKLTTLEGDPRGFTEDIREQAAEQVALVTAKRDKQYQLRDRLVDLSNQYRDAHDYAGAVEELEKIPAPLITQGLDELLTNAHSSLERQELAKEQLEEAFQYALVLAEGHEYDKALGQLNTLLRGQESLNDQETSQLELQTDVVRALELWHSVDLGYGLEETEGAWTGLAHWSGQAFADQLVEQVNEQIKKIQIQRNEQYQLRDELVNHARQHRDAHDYVAEVKELEKIPTPLLIPEIVEQLQKAKGAEENKRRRRKAIEKAMEDSRTLAEEHDYKKALEKLEFTRKLPPGYAEDLRDQADEQFKMITDQRNEQYQLRDELVERAEQHEKTHDYAAIISELEQIPVPLRTGNPIADQFSKATDARGELAVLREAITEGVAGFDSFEFKRLPFYELLSKITRALELKPDDTFFQKKNADMLQRQEKAKLQYEELLEQTEKQFEQYQFEAVSDSAISWPLEVQEYHAYQKERADGAETRLEKLIDLATKGWAIQEDYKAKIRGAPTSRKKIQFAREYLLKAPDDTEFQRLEQQLKAEADIESDQATTNWKEMSASNEVSGATSAKTDKEATRTSILARAWSWIDLSRIRRSDWSAKNKKLIITVAALATVLLLFSAVFLIRSAIKSRAAARHRATIAAVAESTRKSLETYSTENSITLKGHSGDIYSVAFTPDGKQIVSGSGDKTLIIWDAVSGQKTFTLEGHSGRVYSVACSSDSKRIASSSGDKTLKIWNTESGQEIFTFEGHSGPVYSVAFSPDGKRIVSGSGDRTVKVWDLLSGKEIFTLKGHAGAVHSVAFSPDGTQIGSGSSDGKLKIWDALMGEEKNTFSGHRLPIMSVQFHPYGKRIVSGSGDRTIKVWDLLSGQEPRTLNGHSDSVRSVTFSMNGSRIISGASDNTLKVWNTHSGRVMYTIKHHTSSIFCVAASPDGTRIASGDTAHRLRVWRVPLFLADEDN